MPVRDVVSIHCDFVSCTVSAVVPADTTYLFKYGHTVRRIFPPYRWVVHQSGKDGSWLIGCPLHRDAAKEGGHAAAG